ncbi:hypothetical protein, partial [Sagittula sp.]|uniref:hypothetical protein n=1 Tax=Sagittula sp. TaxID=2038081 RepID=UPI00351636A0
MFARLKAPNQAGSVKKFVQQRTEIARKIEIYKKKTTNPEKTACGFERVTVDTPSPAALRRQTGRQTERTGRQRGVRKGKRGKH